ncbi:hypothetical protein GCM10010975_31600 [Comamonas phosphati]|nr:hypothetical protein GCM10010975_31600 [Comamonas phosphati]
MLAFLLKPMHVTLPAVVLLAAPHALARSMAHALLQARQAHGAQARDWQCLAPQPGDAWPAGALVYLLGQDWRESSENPAAGEALARQLSDWRRQLHAQGQAYVVLYGTPAAQWQQLADSLKSMAPDADWAWISAQNPWKPSTRMRRPGCEQCSDPDCERRLFESLPLSRSAPSP